MGNILYGKGEIVPPEPSEEIPEAGDTRIIMGWGAVSDDSGSDHVDTPRFAEATIMDYNDCNDYYFGLDENQICLDTRDSNPGPCSVRKTRAFLFLHLDIINMKWFWYFFTPRVMPGVLS